MRSSVQQSRIYSRIGSLTITISGCDPVHCYNKHIKNDHDLLVSLILFKISMQNGTAVNQNMHTYIHNLL